MKRSIKPPVKRTINTDAITHNGETLTITQWSKRSGVPAFKIYSRLALGWSEAEAITRPKQVVTDSTSSAPKLITHNGETLNAADWSNRTGISRVLILQRLARGWTPERALTQDARQTADAPVQRGWVTTSTL
ncbi:hypothetical protein [Cypionkella sp.]|uniref:hypothetical protein n=1 Tax=Cypionkella sp. TaxID=2811411 RepID=UPI0027173818|nr:hypothetical protein [Cypionkella sp.]MDO8985572.1 hypothetical protein [Cypionkella sp.]MDP2048763.1 hypothetical protein [Cypionkella sp.]